MQLPVPSARARFKGDADDVFEGTRNRASTGPGGEAAEEGSSEEDQSYSSDGDSSDSRSTGSRATGQPLSHCSLFLLVRLPGEARSITKQSALTAVIQSRRLSNIWAYCAHG